jgi:hypothetical protein
VLTALVVMLTVLVGVLGVLVVGLLRSHAEILRRLHDLGAGVYDEHDGPEALPHRSVDQAPHPAAPVDDAGLVGRPAPEAIVGSTPGGGALSVPLVDRPGATLVAFLSSGCVTCASFWDELASPRGRRDLGRGTRLVVVTGGPERESPADIARLAPAGVTTVMSSAAWSEFAVTATPYFALVDEHGDIVGEGTASSWSQVTGLLARAAGDGFGPGRRRPASGPS